MGDTIIVSPVVQSLTVTQETQTVIVSASGPQGIQGIQGPAGVDSGSYAFTQTAPATTWVINHNMHFNPNVTAVDSAGNVIEGTLLYITTDTLEISFGVPVSGHAYLS